MKSHPITDICDQLITRLAQIDSLNPVEPVCDSEPQLDHHTPLPLLHWQDLSESQGERRGREVKRARRCQIDLYQAASGGRAERDELLTAVLHVLAPSPSGLHLPGTALVNLTHEQTEFAPVDVGSDLRLTRITFTLHYLCRA
ncbi:MAG: tail completion protein gp17 [Aeromonas sp.]